MGGSKSKAYEIPNRIMKIDQVSGCVAKARIARFDKKLDQLETIYRQAVEAKPDSWEAHKELADFYGNALKFTEAEAQARKAIQIDPSRIESHIRLATSLVEQKKWQELDVALKEAEKAVPDNLTPYFSAAALCSWRKYDNKLGENYISKYLSQEPEPNMPSQADARRLLGHILYSTGKKAEGIAQLQLAVKLDPNSPAKEELKKMKP
jgi:tetratricopeptide (TPR) repeat protein